VAEMTGEARVVALDRIWPGDITDLGMTREAAGQWLVPELQRIAAAKT
jgi:hypothetical protein